MRDIKKIKLGIIDAGHIAIEQLIKVAKEDIIKPGDDDELSADRLKNAAATKRLAIFDAFEILNKIESEKENLDMLEKGVSTNDSKVGFAERRSR
jgi:ASC-1-like (ASCH) protein